MNKTTGNRVNNLLCRIAFASTYIIRSISTYFILHRSPHAMNHSLRNSMLLPLTRIAFAGRVVLFLINGHLNIKIVAKLAV